MNSEKAYKIFEQVNHLIQESFRTDDSVEILSNYRIPNRRGKKREIDILIKSVVNNTPIQIAIECKDHKRKIGEPSIEAFKAKCESIPNINKKIFISAKGFSKGAKDAAVDYDIDIYRLEEIDLAIIKNWVIFKFYNAFVSHREVKITKICYDDYSEFEGSVERPFIVDFNHQKGIYLNDFVLKFIEDNIPGKVISMTKSSYQSLNFEFYIKHPSALFVHKNKINRLKHIHFNIKHTFSPVKSKIIANRFISGSEEDEILNTATIVSENGEIFSLVRRDQSNKVELITNHGEGFETVDEIDLMNQSENITVKITKSAIFVKEKMDIMKEPIRYLSKNNDETTS